MSGSDRKKKDGKRTSDSTAREAVKERKEESDKREDPGKNPDDDRNNAERGNAPQH